MNVVSAVDGSDQALRRASPRWTGSSFELAENTIHGLLGRNGAGKTTIMQILTGQDFATAGTVEVFGQHPYENAGVLSRICFVRRASATRTTSRSGTRCAPPSSLFPHWDGAFAATLLADFDLPANRTIKKLSRGHALRGRRGHRAGRRGRR